VVTIFFHNVKVVELVKDLVCGHGGQGFNSKI
jgi:hypothetical protein